MNGNGGEDDMFRTIDGGAHWKPVFGGTAATWRGRHVSTTHWRPTLRERPSTGCSIFEIDPADSGHAMFTTGYGGWETFNLTAMDANQPTRGA